MNAGQSGSSERRVYLDWNVIISMADGCLPAFCAALAKATDRGAIVVLFSATHVQEADSISDSERASDGLSERRLQFLSELTKDTYLYNAGDSHSPAIRRESPEVVRRTLNEVPFAKGATHVFLNLFGLDEMKRMRKKLQLNPNDLNNIKPPGVIDQLDEAIFLRLSGWSPELPPGFGIRQLLEKTLQFYPKAETLGVESRMAAVFSMLNSFGFWPDNPKKTSSMAAFFDSMHAANAALCSYFVSEDKALRVKAMAVYEFFGVETQVVSIKEMTKSLER